MSQETARPTLFSCPDCGNLCSLLATACPQCGRPLEDEHKPSSQTSVAENLLAESKEVEQPNKQVSQPNALEGNKFTVAYRLKPQTRAPDFWYKSSKVLAPIIGVVAIVAGIVLCLSGVGAICGLPMILIGVAMISTMKKDRPQPSIIQGKCPYCGLLLNTKATNHGAKCVACAKQFVIRDMKFIRVD